MKDSESKSDESVEQPTHQHTQLETCRICGVDGLPERIAAHDCNTPAVAYTHLRVVDPLLPSSLSSTTQDDTPQPTCQNEPKTLQLEHLTIEWTPTHGPAREVTFEHTDAGWHRIEATHTDSRWQTTSDEPSRPPTLELTKEGHNE